MNLRDQLKEDEGLRLTPYHCTTGKTTIGYGWNLDAHPLPDYIASYFHVYGAISESMAGELLDISIDTATRQCEGIFAYFDDKYDQFTERRRDALINMMFNLGIGGFLGFKKMIAAIMAGDWGKAADEAQDSKWHDQVGARAERIVKELREG